MRFTRSEFDVPCQTLAKDLLGQTLVRKLEDGTVIRGRIVETECYLGGEDKASHSYNGKVTERNSPMYLEPGTAYVYMTYGMYFCFNISSQGHGACVLLRAVEPLEGTESMNSFRAAFRLTVQSPKLKLKELCNGPSKLCISFNINKALNKEDLVYSEKLWIETGVDCGAIEKVIQCPRIGIASAGEEWALKPLRYYIFGDLYVSKRDKLAEENHVQNSK